MESAPYVRGKKHFLLTLNRTQKKNSDNLDALGGLDKISLVI